MNKVLYKSAIKYKMDDLKALPHNDDYIIMSYLIDSSNVLAEEYELTHGYDNQRAKYLGLLLSYNLEEMEKIIEKYKNH